ncbi:MAG: glycosyltransferase [Chryseolinea sp.]
MKKRLLVIVLSNFKHDARVRRQVLALKDHYETTVVCFSGEKEEGFEVISITPTNLTFLRKAVASVFLLLRWYSLAHRILHSYYYLVEELSSRNFDIIIANDVETLPIAFRFPSNARVIFDAHEYAPRHFEDKRSWRLFFQGFNTWLCRKYIPRVSGMMTVGKGLAREYEKNFGRRPEVVMNANIYTDIQPSEVAADKIRLVHHGIATPSRRLELMIEMMRRSRSTIHA